MKMPFIAAAALALAALANPAFGQYPSKPVRIVVPVTTGGPSDLVARILGDKLQASAQFAGGIRRLPGLRNEPLESGAGKETVTTLLPRSPIYW